MSGAKRSGEGRSSVSSRRESDRNRGVAATSSRRDRFERLLTAGLAIFAEHELQPLLQRIADAARDIVGARYAALGVLTAQGTGLAQFVSSGLSDAERAAIGALPQGHGLLGLVIRERRSIRTTDLTRHPERFGFPTHHPPMRSFLGVPVILRDRVFGNLYLAEKIGADAFDAEDERIAALLARKAAVAVENVRLLEQLREFQASRDRFYAMMNHELRNALTGVYGWLDLLVRRGKDAPPSVVEAFRAAEDSVQLLNDLLDLSRLEAGQVEVKAQQTTAEAILADALRGIEPMAAAARVRLEAPELTPRNGARTDQKRVRQILVNLLRNAVQYSPAQEAVRVVLDVDEGVVSFSVIDKGPGIEPERQQHLFDAYTGSNQERAGTGLGLTLSRRLARLLGGDVQVRSQPGRGSTFTLSIARVMSASG